MTMRSAAHIADSARVADHLVGCGVRGHLLILCVLSPMLERSRKCIGGGGLADYRERRAFVSRGVR